MGNVLKHEIKALTYHEVGSRLDGQLEAAQREQSGFDGAKQALESARALVEGLTANVDKELKEGTLDMGQATLAKRWVLRSAGVLENLGIRVEVQNYQAQGKVLALRQAVKVTNSLYTTEKDLWEGAKNSTGGEEVEGDGGRPVARAIGTHPGNPLEERREVAANVVPEPVAEPPNVASEPVVEASEAEDAALAPKNTRIKKGWRK